ncbi:hypothetical protein PAEPH01_2792, partial [Pancytospora epiphaga]
MPLLYKFNTVALANFNIKIFPTIIMSVTCFLLISAVLGILSKDDLYRIAHEPIHNNNGDVYIKPSGPLNLFYGYLCNENKTLHKKRLFSPGFMINYSLTKNGDK